MSCWSTILITNRKSLVECRLREFFKATVSHLFCSLCAWWRHSERLSLNFILNHATSCNDLVYMDEVKL